MVEPGQLASFGVALAAIRLDDAGVLSSENVLARVDFEDPENGTQAQAFSSVLYFHPDGQTLQVYGPTVLREQFASGDYLGMAAPLGDDTEADDPPSVLLGAFVSRD